MPTYRCFYLLILSTICQCKIMDTSRHMISRQKRMLIWNKGGANWVQFIVGLGIPMEVNQQAITIGTVMKAFYLLQTNSSIYTNPSIDFDGRKMFTSRWSLYDNLERFLGRYNYGDGKSCLLRSICEISHVPLDERSGLLAEILSAILRPSITADLLENHTNTDYIAAEKLGIKNGNCESFYPECRIDFINKFFHYL